MSSAALTPFQMTSRYSDQLFLSLGRNASIKVLVIASGSQAMSFDDVNTWSNRSPPSAAPVQHWLS